MSSLTEKYAFKVGKDIRGGKLVSAEEKVEISYYCNEFNINSIAIYLTDTEGFNGYINIEIKTKSDNYILGKSKIEHLEEGWNRAVFESIRSIYQEELVITLKIKGNEKKSIKIGIDETDSIVFELESSKESRDLAVEIDEYAKEIRKIYTSSGWKVLYKVYKIRDKFNKVLSVFKKGGKIIFVLIRNLNISNITRSKDFIKENGFKQFLLKAIYKIKGDRLKYTEWINKHKASIEELESQKLYKFEYEPKVSILIPTYKTPEHLLIETLNSVKEQTYSNWELCIADGNSNEKHVNKILDEYSSNDPRIKVKYLTENKGIAGNTQECYHMATGDYIGLFDHDDLLEPNALFEIVKAVNGDKTIDFIYTDEDKINEKSDYRFDPHFKQDFAIDTFRSYNYICHFSVFRKDLMDKIDGFREGFNGSQDYDIILRATEVAENIYHIPKILYSWRVHSGSTAGNPKNKMYCYDSAKKAIADELRRKGIKGNVKDGKFIGTYEVDYEISDNPKVSILIPTKDHVADLDRTIKSVLSKTTYSNYEIIIIENNSELKDTFEYYKTLEEKHNNIKVVKWESGFNYSAINNYGAKFATGDFILLLNNDVEVINNGWLTKMVSIAQREDVGCVGAKLYYPDNTIQHGGIIVGLGGAAAHAHRCFRKKEYGYFLRLGITHNLSAVTGACLLVKRSVFDEVNGLDESFEVAYNDVDFCLRVLQTGRVNVWTPYAELYHYESKSRGKEDTPEKIERFQGEFNRFRSRYKEFLESGDPYYNKNLTLDREDFTLSNKI